MLDIAAYWMNLGADGFRFDAAKYPYYGEHEKNAEFWIWYMGELKKINPEIVPSINRLSSFAQNDETYFNDILSKRESGSKFSVSVLSRQILKDYKEFALRHCDLINPGQNLSMIHVESIINALKKSESSVISLPHGIYAVIENGEYKFSSTFPKRIKYQSVVLSEGVNFFAGKKIKITVIKDITEKYEQLFAKFNNLFIITSLKCDKIKGNIYARSRLPGDKIKCLNVTKTIKKEFISKKIPCSIRDDIPIICDDEGIIFVPYVGAADRVYQRDASDKDRMILFVEFIDKGDV